jgi:rRNA maturation endonuclease Nob1
VQTGFAVAPVKKGALDYKKVAEIHRENITDTRQTLEAIHEDRSKVSLLPYYLIQSLDEMLFLEFMEMLKRGIQVKRCRLCGRYFELIDKRKREYCEREYSEGKTY